MLEDMTRLSVFFFLFFFYFIPYYPPPSYMKIIVRSRIYRVFSIGSHSFGLDNRLLKAFRFRACTVASGSLLQSRIVLGKNEYWWQLVEGGTS